MKHKYIIKEIFINNLYVTQECFNAKLISKVTTFILDGYIYFLSLN